jgi:hypothetical protein
LWLALGFVAASLALFVGSPHRAGASPVTLRQPTVHWIDRTGGTATAVVAWRLPPSYVGTVTAFAVLEGDLSCTSASLDVKVLSCSIPELSAGATYSFTVQAAFSAAPIVSLSVSSTVGPQGQFITFPTPPSSSFAQGPLSLAQLGVTASSGLAVSYQASGACRVDGDQLDFTSVGSCAVTASQPGDAQFLAAYPVANYFAIAPSPAVLSVRGGSFPDDGRAHHARVVVTPAVPGAIVDYCSARAPVACSTRAPVLPGVYEVKVSLANQDYLASPVSATITVNEPAPAFPPELLGGATTSAGPSKLSFFRGGVVVRSEVPAGHFPRRVSIAVDGVSEESLGRFIVPYSTSLSDWLELFRGSSGSSLVVDAATIHAGAAAALSQGGSIAFPDGGFPGSGVYELVRVQSAGFVPRTTVSAVRHSANPLVLAQAQANASGVVTLEIPFALSWAGQSHDLLLVGSYAALSTSSSSDAAGAVTATVTVPRSLLVRLIDSAPLVMVFADASDPSLRASDALKLPSADAFSKFVRASTPLNLPRFHPTKHPGSTMNRLTGAAAVLSAAAAGIAAARAASAASSAVSAASHASAGTRGASAAHRASTENIEVIHHTHDAERVHVGDDSFTWRAPGRVVIDTLSRRVPVALSRFSPLAAMTLSDGSYWRAMFGSLSLALPAAGLALGMVATRQTDGYPLPPHLNVFLAITVLGFLDAFAGLAAATVSLGAAVVTGHAFTVDMLISGLLLATLWFGLPVMVKKIRPFVRPHPRTFDEWWSRLADFVVGPVFAGFLAAKLVDTFSLTSSLKVGLVAHGDLVGWVVAGVALARYAVSTLTVFVYPRRLGEVTPDHLAHQSERYLNVSILVRMLFAALIFEALLDRVWLVLPLVGLLGLGMWVRGHERSIAVSDWLYRVMPRNLGKILLFEVVGTVATAVISRHIAAGYWQIATLLFVILSLSFVTDLLSGLRGRDWPAHWSVRLASIGLVALTVAQLSGHLIN